MYICIYAYECIPMIDTIYDDNTHTYHTIIFSAIKSEATRLLLHSFTLRRATNMTSSTAGYVVPDDYGSASGKARSGSASGEARSGSASGVLYLHQNATSQSVSGQVQPAAKRGQVQPAAKRGQVQPAKKRGQAWPLSDFKKTPQEVDQQRNLAMDAIRRSCHDRYPTISYGLVRTPRDGDDPGIQNTALHFPLTGAAEPGDHMTPPCVDLPRQLARANASDLKAGTDGEGDVNGTDGDGEVDAFPDGDGAAHEAGGDNGREEAGADCAGGAEGADERGV